MTNNIDWYFDYISPYPYLQLSRFKELPGNVTINPKPVLFAGLLNHWGHKGPAEIPAKARQTYLYTRWLAQLRGLPFIGPPRHPFNPLTLLRITLALNCPMNVIQTIYSHVWGEGNDGQSAESLSALANKLGIDDYLAMANTPSVKAQLKANTDSAISRGVYGVPTFVAGNELFWGDDATSMLIDYLNNPSLFDTPAFARLATITPAAQRTPK